MKKIVIYRDTVEANGKRARFTLRAIAPGPTFIGFYANGMTNDGEVKKLCRDLEPSFTGYYIS